MTQNLSEVAVQQFTDQFTNVYQATEKKLPGTILTKMGLIGESWHASVVDEIVLDDRGAFKSDIPPSSVNYEDVLGHFLNKTKNLPTDIFQQGEVRADDQANLARQSASSIARMEDQIIINQFATDAKVIKNISANSSNLTVEKIRQAAASLDRDEVPSSDRYFIGHITQKESLLGETEVTSSDYNSVRTLVNGQVDTFYGFTFIWFGNRKEGGIPLSGNIRTCFAYHKYCAEAGYGVISRSANPGVTIEWDVRSQSHLVIPKLRMGAKVILGNGITKVLCDESK